MFSETYKTLFRKIKETKIDEEVQTVLEDLILLKYLPRMSYRCSTVSVKIPAGFSIDIDLYSKIYTEIKRV